LGKLRYLEFQPAFVSRVLVTRTRLRNFGVQFFLVLMYLSHCFPSLLCVCFDDAKYGDGFVFWIGIFWGFFARGNSCGGDCWMVSMQRAARMGA
jgi:hypothetical protein